MEREKFPINKIESLSMQERLTYQVAWRLYELFAGENIEQTGIINLPNGNTIITTCNEFSIWETTVFNKGKAIGTYKRQQAEDKPFVSELTLYYDSGIHNEEFTIHRDSTG